MIQYIPPRQSAWEVLKDFVWWYFVVKCNEFHPSLNLNLRECMRSREYKDKESRRVANARYRAHRLDLLYSSTITRRN